MWDRSKLFLRRAGTVILGISILLWFLATYPRSSTVETHFNALRQNAEATTAPGSEARAERLAVIEHEEAGAKLRNSFAGMLGRAIEPLIRPRL
jgi:ferrous iron transport protein B